MPTSYRHIIEPRKSKGFVHREPRPASDAPPPDERDTPSSRMPITLPSMRAAAAAAAGQAVKPPALAMLPPPTPTVKIKTQVSPPSAEQASAQGELLADRYRLVERIGMGGMGTVWRGRSLPLDLDVAVKLIRADASIPDARERLLREARLAARVAHPSAVRVIDCAVTEAGDPFLVMELLRGKSLSRTLAETGPMSAVIAAQLMLPILGALSVAHREGIVHRDVKPANILLVEDGRRMTPKLIDFGIACTVPSRGMRRLTAADVALGSPDYMAPERLQRGGEPDPRTDIWGACTALFELVSGTRPPGGPDAPPARRGTTPERPPRAAASGEHPRFWEIITRGLARDPAERWPTMSALASALAEWALQAGAVWDVTQTSLAVYYALPTGAPR